MCLTVQDEVVALIKVSQKLKIFENYSDTTDTFSSHILPRYTYHR